MLKSLLQKLFSSKEEDISNIKNAIKKENKSNVITHKISKPNKLTQGQVVIINAPIINQEEKSDFKLTKWFVKTGDIVSLGQPLCELENDKLSLEFPSDFDGKITITCKENDKITSDMEICRIEKL